MEIGTLVVGIAILILYLRKRYKDKKKKPFSLNMPNAAQKHKRTLRQVTKETAAEIEENPDQDAAILWRRKYKRAENKRIVQGFKRAGFKRVEIRTQDGSSVCKKAKRHAGVYKISEVPILPCADCDSPNCLCWYKAID